MFPEMFPGELPGGVKRSKIECTGSAFAGLTAAACYRAELVVADEFIFWGGFNSEAQHRVRR